MSKKRIGNCAYCGDEEVVVTHDHVINSGLWPKGQRPKNPVMAWACVPCHKKYDKNFEYFRASVLITADAKQPAVDRILDAAVLPSLRRPQAGSLIRETLASGKLFWAPNEFGVYEQFVNLLINTSAQLDIILKMVKGLHFEHFGEVLGIDRVGATDTKLVTNDKHKEMMIKAMQEWPFKRTRDLGDGPGTFCYRYCDMRPVSELLDTVWVLRFYGSRTFFGFVKSAKRVELENQMAECQSLLAGGSGQA